MEDNKDYKIINIDGTEYETKIPERVLSKEKWEPQNEKHILSRIPGKILEVNVKENQKVKKGETLLLLEAMKMKNQVVAPFSGKVKKIHVVGEQTVPKNFLLLEFE